MNNSRAKTILIIFFMLTNMCLLTLLLHSYNTYRSVPEEVINTTVELLHERGISIDKELVPKSIGIQKQILVENIITTHDDFAVNLLGENTKKNDVGYYSETGQLSFTGDKFHLKYKEGYETNKKMKSPADKAKDYLKTMGISTKGAAISSSNNDKGIFSVIFTKMLHGKPFFDCNIKINIAGTKIVEVTGSWYNKISTDANQLTKSASGLLVNYTAKNPEFTNVKITNLKPGYAINEDGVFHKQAVLLPVYEITTDNNKKIYIDARGN